MLRLAVFIAMLASPALAQEPQCGPYDKVVGGLAAGWQEERQSRGNAPGGALELYANVNTGSWTMIVVQAEGVACVVASGDGYTATPTIPGSDA